MKNFIETIHKIVQEKEADKSNFKPNNDGTNSLLRINENHYQLNHTRKDL